MVALTVSPNPALLCEPTVAALQHGDLLTIWSTTGRFTGAYLGFHVDELGAWLVLQEWVGAPPLYLDFRKIKRAARHSFGGKRHLGVM